jgi:hypothetical protein
MKKIKNIVVITGTYTNREGVEKKRYQIIGSLFEDVANFKVKLDTVPLVEGGWNGWANCYDVEEKANTGARDDIPF